MITESIAILAITLCMIFLFLRAKRPDYAVSLVPLLLVPGAHLLAGLSLRALHVILPCPYQLAMAFVDVAAVACACLLIILFSGKIKSKKNKRIYIFLLTGYNIILTCAFIYQTLEPVLQFYLESLTA